MNWTKREQDQNAAYFILHSCEIMLIVVNADAGLQLYNIVN